MKDLPRNTAWLYDFDGQNDILDDVPFYAQYALSRGGSVLELGCGTGRVALALAEQGLSVTGLDLSLDMLDIFKKKLNAKPQLKHKINIVHGDMADFQLDQTFGLIIAPFHAFQALTAEEAAQSFLRCVRAHLSDPGVFIVNVFKPYALLDEGWCYGETVVWEGRGDSDALFIVKTSWGDKIDVGRQIIYPHLAYEVTDSGGTKTRYTEDLALKYYYEPQLTQLVESSGFRIIARYGWYDKEALDGSCREIIFVCQKD